MLATRLGEMSTDVKFFTFYWKRRSASYIVREVREMRERERERYREREREREREKERQTEVTSPK